MRKFILKEMFDQYFSFIIFISCLVLAFSAGSIHLNTIGNNIVGTYQAETISDQLYDIENNVLMDLGNTKFYDQDRILRLKPTVLFKKNGDVVFITPNDVITHYTWHFTINKLILYHTTMQKKFGMGKIVLDYNLTDEGGIVIPEYKIYLKPIEQ